MKIAFLEPLFKGGRASTVRDNFSGPGDMRERRPALLCQIDTLPSMSLNVTRARPFAEKVTAEVGALWQCRGEHLPFLMSNTCTRPSTDPTATCWVVGQ